MSKSTTTMDRISDRELVITRSFRAPAAIVFDAYTKAENVKRWWAPKSRGVTMAECEVALVVGGAYRYVLARGESKFAFFGTFVEIARPTRVVYTQRFEPVIGKPLPGEANVTVTFEEGDGATLLRSHERYASKDVLDGVLASGGEGMEDGMRETMEQLAALVAERAAT